MDFKTVKDLKFYLKHLRYLGMGAQGSCYLRENDKTVFKVFHYFDESYYTSMTSEKYILRFSDIKNKTFIWPNDIITTNGQIVGYMVPYKKAKNLDAINPLNVNLENLSKSIDRVREDIHIISNQGVQIFDITYNILYNRLFHIIDQDEYSLVGEDPSILERKNNRCFDYGIYLFLIDSFFDSLVNDDKLLKELYKSKQEDIKLFIEMLKKKLSELCGEDIIYLRQAKQYQDEPRESMKYIRSLKRD